MRYPSDQNFLHLKVGTLHERKFLLKEKTECELLFLSPPVNQQTQRDVVSKSAGKDMYSLLISMIYSPQFLKLLTNHETHYNLKTVLSFHLPFEPISVPFTITGYLLLFLVFRKDFHTGMLIKFVLRGGGGGGGGDEMITFHR